MQEEIRIWQIINNDDFKELEVAKLDFESRLETLLLKDISFISDDLMVIGKQVRTDYNGIIDILCMDEEANLVVIELKKDKTPRDTVAQALDYSSWVMDLTYDHINTIFKQKNSSDSDTALEDSFKNKFKQDLPEDLNKTHRILIVGSNIDGSTERIIRYLNQRYGVDINSIRFKLFKDAQGNELLSRNFLIKPEEVQQKVIRKSGELRPLYDEQKLMDFLNESPNNNDNSVIRAIYDWTKNNENLGIDWSMVGKKRGVLFYPVFIRGDKSGVIFAVDKNSIRLWFQHYEKILSETIKDSVIEELISELNKIEGIMIKQKNGLPAFPLKALANPEPRKKFFEIFERFMEAVKADI